MIVASSFVLGKSDILGTLADDLTGLVRRSIRDGASLDELERSVFQRVLSMGRAAVDMFLEGQGNGDLGESIATEEGVVLHRSETVTPRPVRTIFGEHCFEAFVYSRGAKQKIELRPIDARLNLPHGKASYLFQEFTQMFCVEKAFGVAARQFGTVFQQQLSVDVLEEINREMGTQADGFLDSLTAPAVADEGELLVTTADGKGVPLVQQDAQKIPVFDEKERPGNRRMATLGCVYTVNRHIRTPEQIVAALFHDDAEPPPETRPEPCGKRYRGYFTYTEPDEEPLPSAYRTWTWIAREVTARHQDGQPVIRLMDGQPSLWNAADACLDEFVERLRQRRETNLVIDVLDVIHVSSYVWRAAKVFHAHKEHQEAFAHERLLRILRGEVSGVVKGLRRMATEHELGGSQLKEVSTVCNYFENNARRMRYDEYLKAGYPIASGVIEGACRHIIKDRMEQGGMRWRQVGAEAMLNVRAVNASSEREKFGHWRQQQEAKRVHPHRALVTEYQGFHA
jgi:hypothetical protein